MVGPDRFIGPVHTLLPCVQFCTSAPAQDALCKALVKAAEPYEDASRLHTYTHTHITHHIYTKTTKHQLLRVVAVSISAKERDIVRRASLCRYGVRVSL